MQMIACRGMKSDKTQKMKLLSQQVIEHSAELKWEIFFSIHLQQNEMLSITLNIEEVCSQRNA
ncbi:hypothetical protein T02_12306 [Trichinella nativa]|uniref:Uncharacterized protein n=1 Tax=Trichinella nativa TaxID=6335 RepID=A0A0V1LQA1_9BILA|nr:hypothetical protein T02_12306 [Trichinella nativa]